MVPVFECYAFSLTDCNMTWHISVIPNENKKVPDLMMEVGDFEFASIYFYKITLLY